MIRSRLLVLSVLGLMCPAAVPAAPPQAADPLAWPPATKDTRPGTRWWWMGSAVEPADIARELRQFHEAGLGTVEITPIYGVHGAEAGFLEYLGPKWMDRMRTAVTEAGRLDMNVDMATGTGWCFGGPNVGTGDANATASYKNGTVSQKPSGVKVKRPAPGGAGWMLNLLYPDAMTRYLQRFGDAFAHYNGPKPRMQFHDSYEYKSDWSPDLFAQFEKRRGYKLQGELPALFEGKGDADHVARVKDDYRATASELIVESTERWTKWSHERGFLTRDQAHGSPGNWLDIYAASDVPETEFDFTHGDVLISKFASSAAHLTGRRMVSSETGTWSAEHFTETLARLKEICDGFYLSGVNRIMWHGTAYSPADAAWPGWCFYASTEMNPRNALWRDAAALHAYLTRVQGMMQAGGPGEDVLLYWPLHEFWRDPGGGLLRQLTVHAVDWFHDQPVGRMAELLRSRGAAFDYVSDKLLGSAEASGGAVVLGGHAYRAVVVPECAHMPLATMKLLAGWSAAGVPVVFEQRVPDDVPGLADVAAGRDAMRKLAAGLHATPSAEVLPALEKAGARIERSLAGTHGLEFVRRSGDGGMVYLVVNRGSQAVDQPVVFASTSAQPVLMDPMTGRTGVAAMTGGALRIQLEPRESVIVNMPGKPVAAGAAAWQYRRPTGAPVPLAGAWEVKFLDGGPVMPKPFQSGQPGSWTAAEDPDARNFAGTACYTLHFDAPAGGSARQWTLDLGRVVQSARVRLNGTPLGTRIQAPYRVDLGTLKERGNLLEIEVTGTSANRIRDLDVRGVKWKIFYDTNIVTTQYKPFDASKWPVAEQGLIGPVTLCAQESAAR